MVVNLYSNVLLRMRCSCGVVKCFFYLCAYIQTRLLHMWAWPNSSRPATHKNFSFVAGKNKGGYCIGTSQIFGSNCTVSTPLNKSFHVNTHGKTTIVKKIGIFFHANLHKIIVIILWISVRSWRWSSHFLVAGGG